MNVQELCDRLLDIAQHQLAAVLENNDDIPDTDFPEALTTKWLADNIQAVFEATNRGKSRQDELIGDLEVNAFLASFQKAYQDGRRTRIGRWAGTYSLLNRMASDTGALQKQLRHIGVKVEDEWLIDVLKLTAGANA